MRYLYSRLACSLLLPEKSITDQMDRGDEMVKAKLAQRAKFEHLANKSLSYSVVQS
jgi:hypothetical protein